MKEPFARPIRGDMPQTDAALRGPKVFAPSEARALPDVIEPLTETEIIEDVFWGLMSSREFLFNH